MTIVRKPKQHQRAARARGRKKAEAAIVTFRGVDQPCVCSICKQHKTFSIPKTLVEEFAKGDVVVFAGAGISTENRQTLNYTFYESIASELGDKSNLSFPDLMSKYASQPNGRIKLVEQIRERIEQVETFPTLYRDASEFHAELGTIPSVGTIVTTNWDKFFENECFATPFVFPEDFAYWETSDRKVLKIHGTIDNLGSMVVTREDYQKSAKLLRSGAVGAFLRTILIGKTVVFFGYSLRDNDFLELLKLTQAAMKGFHRQFYAVTIDEDGESRRHLEKLKVVPITTDATFFLSQIKKHLWEGGAVLDDSIYSNSSNLLSRVRDAERVVRGEFPIKKLPQVIFAGFYLDGLIHCLERVIAMRGSGRYSSRAKVHQSIHGYVHMREERAARKKYDDVAYIDGYLAGLIFVAKSGDVAPPLWYAYGDDAHFSKAALRRSLRSFSNRAALRFAARTVKKNSRDGEELVIVHRCQLV